MHRFFQQPQHPQHPQVVQYLAMQFSAASGQDGKPLAIRNGDRQVFMFSEIEGLLEQKQAILSFNLSRNFYQWYTERLRGGVRIPAFVSLSPLSQYFMAAIFNLHGGVGTRTERMYTDQVAFNEVMHHSLNILASGQPGAVDFLSKVNSIIHWQLDTLLRVYKNDEKTRRIQLIGLFKNWVTDYASQQQLQQLQKYIVTNEQAAKPESPVAKMPLCQVLCKDSGVLSQLLGGKTDEAKTLDKLISARIVQLSQVAQQAAAADSSATLVP